MRRLVVVLMIFGLFYGLDLDAQCAMCKENVASSQSGDIADSFGNGINSGILFLMAIPYVFIMSIVYIVFRKKISAFASNLFPKKAI